MIRIELQDTLSGFFNLSPVPVRSNSTGESAQGFKNRKTETWFAKLMWALSGPIIVMPGYVDMPIPESIRNRIQIERLLLCTKDEQLASEPEAMWYISTASLRCPLDQHRANVFFYLTRKHMLSIGKTENNLPDFLQNQIILDPHMEEVLLHNLRSWLFKRSFENVKSRLKS